MSSIGSFNNFTQNDFHSQPNLATVESKANARSVPGFARKPNTAAVGTRGMRLNQPSAANLHLGEQSLQSQKHLKTDPFDGHLNSSTAADTQLPKIGSCLEPVLRDMSS